MYIFSASTPNESTSFLDHNVSIIFFLLIRFDRSIDSISGDPTSLLEDDRWITGGTQDRIVGNPSEVHWPNQLIESINHSSNLSNISNQSLIRWINRIDKSNQSIKSINQSPNQFSSRFKKFHTVDLIKLDCVHASIDKSPSTNLADRPTNVWIYITFLLSSSSYCILLPLKFYRNLMFPLVISSLMNIVCEYFKMNLTKWKLHKWIFL